MFNFKRADRSLKLKFNKDVESVKIMFKVSHKDTDK